RFGRSMTTDVHLALWVTIANAIFVALLFRRSESRGNRWLLCITAGAAIGLALMSKGPVALVQTLLPLVIFLVWRHWRGKDFSSSGIGWGPIIAGVIVALAIALPWPLWVLSRMSDQIGKWYREVTRTGAIEDAGDPAWVYFALIPLVLPW